MTKAAKNAKSRCEPSSPADSRHHALPARASWTAMRCAPSRDRMRPPAAIRRAASGWCSTSRDVSHLDYRGVPWLVSQTEGFRQRGGDLKLCRPVALPPGHLPRGGRARRRSRSTRDAGDARTALSQGRRLASLTRGPLAVRPPDRPPDEVVQLLNPVPGKGLVDGTLGGGGHAEALLAGGAEVIGVDRDPTAIAAARAKLAGSARFRALEGRAGELESLLGPLGLLPVDGLLLDLGVSAPSWTPRSAASPSRPTVRSTCGWADRRDRGRADRPAVRARARRSAA